MVIACLLTTFALLILKSVGDKKIPLGRVVHEVPNSSELPTPNSQLPTPSSIFERPNM